MVVEPELLHWSVLLSLFKLSFFFECQHPFIDDPFVTTEPAVGSARLLGLGPFSSPGPVVSWSRDLTI